MSTIVHIIPFNFIKYLYYMVYGFENTPSMYIIVLWYEIHIV